MTWTSAADNRIITYLPTKSAIFTNKETITHNIDGSMSLDNAAKRHIRAGIGTVWFSKFLTKPDAGIEHAFFVHLRFRTD